MNKQITKNNGQTLVEFILLFAITMLISYTMLDLVNNNIADVWKNYIEVITGPSPDKFDFN
mgnify:CR=1 FL=1